MKIEVTRVSGDFDLDYEQQMPLPRLAYPGDAGFDLFADEEPAIFYRGERQLVRTGLAFAIPRGMVGLIMPRSGLAHEHGLTVLNAPGVIDSGYRGEVKVNLVNLGLADYVVRRGDRIAQILFQRVETPELVEVERLDRTARGTGGHGSSKR